LEANSSWNFGSAGQGYPCVTDSLGALITRLGCFKVFIAKGYYDLDIGYFATAYDIDHMGPPPALRANITLCFYDAGHQIYVHLPSLKKLKGDVADLLKNQKAAPANELTGNDRSSCGCCAGCKKRRTL
jgi:carboxypeptidase C (cathepsin A)